MHRNGAMSHEKVRVCVEGVKIVTLVPQRIKESHVLLLKRKKVMWLVPRHYKLAAP